MTYVEYVNGILMERVETEGPMVLYGQNMDAGSCLSGLTRGLSAVNAGMTLNTPNSENTLVGVGFGMMLNGVNCAFCMKQQDFLLLGIDHLVNTYNVIRQTEPTASFTILPVIVDSGYEGPQSALNNFNDFCSIARVDGYAFTNRADTKRILESYFVNTGFRILGVRQRLFKKNLLDLDVVAEDPLARFFQYTQGEDVTIVCFNFALPYGHELAQAVAVKGASASLFSVNTYGAFDFSPILDDIGRTRNVVVIDDTKSGNRLSDKFIAEVHARGEASDVAVIDRPLTDNWFYPRHDQLEIDYESVAEQIVDSLAGARV